MKLSLYLSIALIATFGTVSAKKYYVSTTGNNSNSGLTLALPWKTITYAASSTCPVIGGDTVYVKAGNYGAEYVSFQKSGVSGKPICYIGYQATPGDSPNLNYKIGDALNAAVMPLLNGGDRAASKIGMNLPGRSYITIKNFQITNYAYGVNTGNASYLTLDNIITMYTGDIVASYSGRGIQLGSWGTSVSSYNNISNCVVVNSAAEGLSINGNNNTVTNCRVYCNEGLMGSGNNASTDYYLIVCGNNNTITGCYTERVGNLAHYGHGTGVKYDCLNNTFIGCKSVNMTENFYVRHRGVKYNTFKNCVAVRGRGFCIRDGASYNTYENCIADSTTGGIRIQDTSEDGGAQYAGRHNVIKNCIIKNSSLGVFFDDYDQVSPADSNTIVNCTFDNIDYLFYCGRENKNNEIVNCIISNVDNLKSGSYALSMNFNYSNFYNNKFATPAGTKNTTANPLYVNASTQDYHLQATSPCKDLGATLSYITQDYDGNARPQGAGVDIGAYEFQEITSTLSATVASTNVSCYGGNNGKATVTISGGKGPYTYVWSNGQTAASSTGLIAGNYSVTVTDMLSASKKLSVSILQPSSAVTSTIASQANVSCNGGMNGSATINASGGVGPYKYMWSPSGQTTATATGLSALNYSVTITDANGCNTPKIVTLTQPSALIATVSSQTNVSCYGSADGSAVINPSGGTGAYKYLWSPSNQITATATGLSALNYSVTITDANGCNTQKIVTLTQPSAIVATVSSQTNVSCYGGNNGSAVINPSGGIGTYQYLWTPSNQTSPTATGLSALNYVVTLKDANGCTTQKNVTITQPLEIMATITSLSYVRCYGGSDGSATLSPSGGVSPYKFLWLPTNQTTASVSGLKANTYTVNVGDANGCSIKKLVNITQPAPLKVSSVNVTNPTNCETTDGVISVEVEGGTSEYTFLWNTTPPQELSTAYNLRVNSYSVSITDKKGCKTHAAAAVSCATSTNSDPAAIAVAVYPNPTSSEVNIQAQDIKSILITNMSGQEVYNQSNLNGDKVNIDLDHLNIPASIYMITVKTASNTFTKQLAYTK